MRIAGGVLLIICGIVMLVAGIFLMQESTWVVIVGSNQPSTLGLITLILTVPAILGGIIAIIGRHFKLAIGGAVCAVASTFIGLPPMVIFSIPALAFILLQHRAFD